MLIKNKEMPLKNYTKVYNHRQPVKIFIIPRGLEDATKSTMHYFHFKWLQFDLCQANI